MTVSRSYRCLNCMDYAVERSFDVSHLSLRCTSCGEFGRFVNTRVLDQFDAFEADPPEALNWGSLDRDRKLLVAEQVARRGRSVADLAPDDPEPAGNHETADDPEPTGSHEPADDRVSGDGGTSGGEETGVTDSEGVADGGRDGADGDGADGTDEAAATDGVSATDEPHGTDGSAGTE